MTPQGALTVFVIDDDAAVRASIQGLLKSVSLRSEAFATTREFLRSKRAGSSTHSFPLRLTALAWDFASADQSLSRMAADCGPPTMLRAERVSISPWQ